MANTANYDWPLPSPRGIQISEVAKIATSLIAIDAKLKSTETALSTHKHKFADLLEKPTTLGGYGITDGMTATEIADAIQQAISNLVNGSGAALDTLKELADALGNDPDFAANVSTALGVRVRVDAATNFSLAQRAQGRANIDALGTVDRGATGGVASLDSGGKVPTAQLPALTTTATVGAAIAGANAKTTPDDGDFFTGVAVGGGTTMFKATWANIRSALQSVFDGRYLQLSGGILSNSLQIIRSSVGFLALLDIRNSGAGDVAMRMAGGGRDFSGQHIEIGQRANGDLFLWNGAGVQVTFSKSGVLASSGDLTAGGSGWVYSGASGGLRSSMRPDRVVVGGGGTLFTDGNTGGPKWEPWGSFYAFEAISNRIEARSYDRTRDYLLSEQVPVGGYVLARFMGNPGTNNPQSIGGGDLAWSNVDCLEGGRINYGTWAPSGVHYTNGRSSSPANRTTSFKRIG